MSYETETVAAAIAHAATIRFPAKPHTASPAQEVRARTAVERAIALRKLQAEYEATGFLAVPLDEYLTRLARMAGVPLPLPSPAPAERSPVAALKPWLAVANALEMTASHVRLWVRTWFATGFAPTRMSHAAARSTHSSGTPQAGGLNEHLSPDAADAALGDVERAYAPARRQELEAALRLIE